MSGRYSENRQMRDTRGVPPFQCAALHIVGLGCEHDGCLARNCRHVIWESIRAYDSS
jgi:hypothetical protein